MNRELLIQVHNRINPFIHQTPVLSSHLINEIAGTQVHFKCENFQKMGAFKMRGAMNAILNLSENDRKKGVLTHSSGNFAQALALAAKKTGTSSYIVMPENAPQVKKDAVRAYGGIIIECDSSAMAREDKTNVLQKENEYTFIHPSNNLDVILGHATSALEFLKELPDLNFIVTPIGGGGLVAGTILAVNCFSNNCGVVGGEPFEADDAFRSLKNGKIEYNQSTNTIADGLKSFLGDVNFPIIKEGIDSIIRVMEHEIIQAMKLIWERMKIIIEPSSAVAFAALLKEKKKFKSKTVGIILSGGNIDISNLPFNNHEMLMI